MKGLLGIFAFVLVCNSAHAETKVDSIQLLNDLSACHARFEMSKHLGITTKNNSLVNNAQILMNAVDRAERKIGAIYNIPATFIDSSNAIAFAKAEAAFRLSDVTTYFRNSTPIVNHCGVLIKSLL